MYPKILYYMPKECHMPENRLPKYAPCLLLLADSAYTKCNDVLTLVKWVPIYISLLNTQPIYKCNQCGLC